MLVKGVEAKKDHLICDLGRRELSLIGSTEWVEDHATELQQKQSPILIRMVMDGDC